MGTIITFSTIEIIIPSPPPHAWGEVSEGEGELVDFDLVPKRPWTGVLPPPPSAVIVPANSAHAGFCKLVISLQMQNRKATDKS